MKKIKLILLTTTTLLSSFFTSHFSLAQDIFDPEIEKQIKAEGKQKEKEALEKAQEEARKKTEAIENLKKQAEIDMIKVEGGIFEMGNIDPSANFASPVHKVSVSSFYMGKYEVTQKEYESIMGYNPSTFKGQNLPVETVSFNEAVKFCNKYNQSKGLPNAYDDDQNIINFTSYRLPTEAEWEYAARGGNKSQGYTYSGSINNADEVAWYGSNSGSKTHEVGTKKANELGLYDMSGNVIEFCSDWFDIDYYVNSPLSNPYNNKRVSFRVTRGGAWHNEASLLRVVFRLFSTPTQRSEFLGFRLVKTIN